METLPTVAPANPPTPMDIIARVASEADPDKMAKLMELQERWERSRAEAELAGALTRFQAECPPIHKGRKADRFSFAGFDDIIATIRPLLARFGLSVSFDTEHAEAGAMKATCIVRKGIASHRTTMSVPVPVELRVNKTQQFGAALSYVKRYTLCSALNIVVTDEDVDAENLHSEAFITEQQAKTLANLIGKLPPERQAKFWPAMRIVAGTLHDGTIDIIGSIQHLPAARYAEVHDSLASATQPKKGA